MSHLMKVFQTDTFIAPSDPFKGEHDVNKDLFPSTELDVLRTRVIET